MGMGTTIQTVAFLPVVIRKDADLVEQHDNLHDKVTKGLVLILCPASIFHNWDNEFFDWAALDVVVYHGSNCEVILEKLPAHGIAKLITSFNTFKIQDRYLSGINGEPVVS